MKWNCDKEDRLEWSDIEVDSRNVNLGLKSIVVKSWLTSTFEETEPTLESAWGINFSGLWCLGTHPVANGRLPHNSFVFQISGSYFSSASYIRGHVESNQIPRFLHIGTVDDSQVCKRNYCIDIETIWSICFEILEYRNWYRKIQTFW